MKGYLRSATAVSRPKVVGSVSLGHGVNEFFSIVIPPVIPLLVTELGISYAQAGLLLTVFFIMYSIFQLPAGIIADHIGKARLIIAGLAGMSLGIFLASMAPTFEVLLLAQCLTGICGSTFHPAGMAIVSDAETGATEGRAMGLFGSGGKVGTMAAPLLVGGIAAIGGWRIALVGAAVMGLITTIALIPVLGFGRRKRDSNGDQLRRDGGQSVGQKDRIRNILSSIKIPVTKQVVILFFVTILISIQSRAIQTFTTAYLVEGTQVSISVGNIGFFALLLGGGVSQIISGSLADQFNRGIIGGVASILTAVLVGGTILIAMIGGIIRFELLVLLIFAWLFLIGAMMYSTSPIKNALVSEMASKEYSGGLFGVIQTGSAIGSAIGPVLFGVIATEWGITAAYPVVAIVSVALAVLFFVLWALNR